MGIDQTSQYQAEVSARRRRAQLDVNGMRDDLLILERRLKGNGTNAEPADAQSLVRRLSELVEHLTALEILRQVGEWDK
jgi:hypothetical protein